MIILDQMISDINVLADFLGVRDVPVLDGEHLLPLIGKDQADVMVLFGGSILAGGDILAEAMQRHVAKTYMIVGGEGHTTKTLRNQIKKIFPDLDTDGKPEAVLFNEFLKRTYGLQADFLETNSTNCGNNITYMLQILRANEIPCDSIILTQDATMQRRMSAGLAKYAPEIKVVNFASYEAEIVRGLIYKEEIKGMWPVDRYIELLMGEIPRLTDDENGYGPNGKNFIAHVDIPEEIQRSFERLKEAFPSGIRAADSRYAG